MKITLFAILLACASAAVGQNYGSAPLTNPISLPGHPERAEHAAMASEQNLWGDSPYTYAKGELPLSEFGRVSAAVPLGDIARNYRKQHATAKRAVIVWAN